MLTALAFSPDGSLIAVGGADNVIRVWDRSSGEKKHELKGLEGTARSIVFSPDGKQLAAGSSAAADVPMWDVQSGALVRTFKPAAERERDFVLCLAFRTDGSRLAAARLSSTMTIWEASSGREERSVKTGLISALGYRSDNRVLIAADLAKKLVFWQFGSAMESVERALADRPTLLALSSNGERIAVALGTRQVQVWDAEQRRQLVELADAAMTIRDLAFAEDGPLVLVGSAGNTVQVRIWKYEP
jgi:WD40 repeat protein